MTRILLFFKKAIFSCLVQKGSRISWKFFQKSVATIILNLWTHQTPALRRNKHADTQEWRVSMYWGIISSGPSIEMITGASSCKFQAPDLAAKCRAASPSLVTASFCLLPTTISSFLSINILFKLDFIVYL